jgi:hypothetical protein
LERDPSLSDRYRGIVELRLHVAPVLLGAGERLFEGVGDVSLEPVGVKHTPLVIHTSYRVRSPERTS